MTSLYKRDRNEYNRVWRQEHPENVKAYRLRNSDKKYYISQKELKMKAQRDYEKERIEALKEHTRTIFSAGELGEDRGEAIYSEGDVL